MLIATIIPVTKIRNSNPTEPIINGNCSDVVPKPSDKPPSSLSVDLIFKSVSLSHMISFSVVTAISSGVKSSSLGAVSSQFQDARLPLGSFVEGMTLTHSKLEFSWLSQITDQTSPPEKTSTSSSVKDE